MENNSYQKRIVSYEKIHSIDESDFEKLVSIVNPQNEQVILDACCGYGAVSKRLLETIKLKNLDTKITLLDSSDLQLSRAKESLQGQNLDFVISDAIKTPFPENHFDTIVNKMGLHEVDKESQEQMMKEFYRILKPGGKMIIWELALDDKSQQLFSKIVQKKDELAGFDSLVRNRYFPKKEEVISLLDNTGFENSNVEHNVFPNLSIRNRKEEFVSADRLRILEEKGFLEESDNEQLEKISEEKIEQLRSFIKENLSEEEKLLMNYSETENDTIYTAPKAIFKANKPE
ncbi:MAG: class I SAM-dependent methyltransferase [Minisyncoccia bacterium]